MKRKAFGLFLLVVAINCGFFLFWKYTSHPGTASSNSNSLVESISLRASSDRWILIAAVDVPYVAMAINFYETSIRKHSIDNFLFVGFGEPVCRILRSRLIPCFSSSKSTKSNKSSSYFTRAFKRKSHWRNDVILSALYANFTVLYSDVDITFFKNPFPDLMENTAAADVAPQWDRAEHNSGFVVVRPTLPARKLYEDMNKMSRRHPEKLSEQVVMNMVIKKSKAGLNIFSLTPPKYQSGMDYFESSGRMFANVADRDCAGEKCILVVHNNWMVGRSAKIYRFREHLMWMYDEDLYYSNESQKYIAYGNSRLNCQRRSAVTTKSSIASQLYELKTAMSIGFLLKRVVILPRFYCSSKCTQCALNSFLNIERFDTTFKNRYRESSFLLHPKVPKTIKGSVLPVHLATKETTLHRRIVISEGKLVRRFRGTQQSVINFDSLYWTSVALEKNTKLVEMIDTGFRSGEYRQY